MFTKTKAIVLHSLKFGEDQRIVDCYTAGQGRVSFFCHLSRSPKGKVKKQYFQPLSLLNVEYDFRQNRHLQHLRNLAIGYPYSSIPFDPYKLSLAIFISEFLSYALRGEQQNLSLFQFIQKSLEWLDGCKRSFSNFHLIFMLRMSRFIGFYPNLENSEGGKYFDLREGRFVTFPPLHPNFLQPSEAASFVRFFQYDYATMSALDLSHDQRNHWTEVILDYYRLHVPDFPELKSLSVLRELFA